MLKKSLLLAALLLAPLAVIASDLPAYPFIHVTGSAMQYVMPDVGAFDFEVVAAGTDAAQARAEVEARVAEIQALAQEQQLPADDVTVRDARQTIRKGEGSEAAPVYEVRCAVRLNVRDLSKWKPIAEGLLGKANLDNFATDFSPADREQIESALTKEAITQARQRAAAIAAGFGRKLGAVAGVSTGPLKNLTNAMGLYPTDFIRHAPGGGGNRVDKADIVNIVPLRFSSSVDVIFRIR